MKIKHKLVLLVSLALVGMLAIGLVGLSNSEEALDVFQDIDNDRIPKLILLGDLSKSITSIARRTNEVLSKGLLDPETQTKELNRLVPLAEEPMKGADALVKKINTFTFNTENKEQLDIVNKYWSDWIQKEFETLEDLKQTAASHPTAGDLQAFHKRLGERNVSRREVTPVMLAALNKLIENNKQDTTKIVEDTVVDTRNAIRAQIVILIIVLLLLAVFSWFIQRSIMQPINQMQETLADVAHNKDLTRRATSGVNDEIGALSSAFNHTMDALQDAFREILTQTAEITHALSGLSIASEQVAQSSARQSNSTSAMAASVEEMTVSINTVSNNADDAQKLAQEAGGISEQGGHIIEKTSGEIGAIAQTVANASQVIQNLGEASKEISNIVQVIKDVADQTNLLALNAAIEAARAGEQGRGFAVVADEVRKLAERTAQSTGDISAMVSKIQVSSNDAVMEMQHVVDQVESGKALAQEAGERMHLIREESGKVSSAVTEISGALKEQSQASQEIARHVESIAQMTEENNAAAEETATGAKRLGELAEKVEVAIRRFKV